MGLRKESNHKSWNQWQSKHTLALQRLVNPACDLPHGLFRAAEEKNKEVNHHCPPNIFIRWNKGDPLHDDGQQLVDAMLSSVSTSSTTAKSEMDKTQLSQRICIYMNGTVCIPMRVE